MKIAKIGSDYVEIMEDSLKDFVHIDKIHLIKLMFKNPTKELLDQVLSLYKNTNRFIVSDHVRFYNSYLRNTNKKYYIENKNLPEDPFLLVSFFRKNNKILFNFSEIDLKLKEYILNTIHILNDLLSNVEVISITKEDYQKFSNIFKDWPGNIILK